MYFFRDLYAELSASGDYGDLGDFRNMNLKSEKERTK